MRIFKLLFLLGGFWTPLYAYDSYEPPVLPGVVGSKHYISPISSYSFPLPLKTWEDTRDYLVERPIKISRIEDLYRGLREIEALGLRHESRKNFLNQDWTLARAFVLRDQLKLVKERWGDWFPDYDGANITKSNLYQFLVKRSKIEGAPKE
jgi:hypothetical protein